MTFLGAGFGLGLGFSFSTRLGVLATASFAVSLIYIWSYALLSSASVAFWTSTRLSSVVGAFTSLVFVRVWPFYSAKAYLAVMVPEPS